MARKSKTNPTPNEPSQEELLRTDLKNRGLTDQMIDSLIEMGVDHLGEMRDVQFEDLIEAGVPRITARQIVKEFSPAIVPAATESDKSPSEADVNSYATSMGIDPNMLQMLMFANMGAGAGMDMDLSSMLPISQIVAGYNPKLRNMSYMIMGQVERRMGGHPLIVINADGSVNPDLTQQYIMSLEEGFEPAADNVYYDTDGNPYELIKVGVDAQSIYDADPLDSSRALPKNGIGTGRVNWTGVPLDVKQVVYLAVIQTGELNSADEAKLQWLRSNVKPGMNRLTLRGEFPKALGAYNEAARTGALPTLRVQLSRGARRPEVMPRRRSYDPKGGTGTTGDSFRHDDDKGGR